MEIYQLGTPPTVEQLSLAAEVWKEWILEGVPNTRVQWPGGLSPDAVSYESSTVPARKNLC